MKKSIHYAFQAKLIKSRNENGEFDFIETYKEFFNDEPIEARESAFRYYQNYIEVLLEAKGLEYESDKETSEVLESFYDPKTSHKTEYEGITIPDSWGNGIGVFMVVDELNDTIHDTTNDDIIAEIKAQIIDEKNKMIHGIGFLWDGTGSPESLMRNLDIEYKIYHIYNFKTNGNEKAVVFCDSDEWLEGYRDNEPATYIILKTPFDWSGMDKPYWWGEPDEKEPKEEPKFSRSEIFKELIRRGESNQREFKPTLLYNFKTNSASIGVKGIIAKTICAFLNSNGGFLFIGVKDDGSIQGLDYDFSLDKENSPKDFFRLEFDDMLKQFIPNFSTTNISGDFTTIDEKEIFIVTVFPSKTRPVFMNGQFGKEFWVRWTASTRQYTDMEEIANYCLEHWRNTGI